MAASKQTTKKKTASRAAPKKTAARKAPARRRPDYRIRRRAGFVCFVLCVLSAFGWFDVHALLIDLLVDVQRGLVGFGFWPAPAMLFAASAVLIFHGGMPVRLRTVSVLLIPTVIGALYQTFTAAEAAPINWALVQNLWFQGQEMRSGGVLGGVLSRGLVLLVSKWGAVLALFVLLITCIMVLFRVTPTQILRWINDARERRRQYRLEQQSWQPEDWDESAQEEEPEPAPLRLPFFSRRERFTVPEVEEEAQPAPESAGQEPVEKPAPLPLKKRKALVRTDNVPAPPEAAPAGTGSDDPLLQLLRPAPKQTDKPVPPPPAPPMPLVEEAKPEPAAAPKPVEKPAEAKRRQEQAEITAEVSRQLDQELSRKTEYVRPPLTLLTESGKAKEDARKEIAEVTERLDDTFEAFGIDAHVIGEIRGPTVTQYEVIMGRGVKLNRVTGMADDITVHLGVEKVRIAPIPGKSQVVGVEIPNRRATPVPIRDVLSSNAFRTHKSPVAFALGKDISGEVVVGNIAKLPHMLIAGTTGSGKSVCTNSIVISLLYRSSPEQVRLIMIDPKIVEFEGYNGIPHLLIPVVTDPKKAAGALQWAVTEMLKRYRTFAARHVRDLDSYNQQVRADRDTTEEPFPRIVVIIDELADLMLVASKEVEEAICRLAQMGRAAGMHLIIATQRPSSDVITGLMKANIPSRIALTVSSGMESRIILDTQGAEKLLGNGDMLYNPVGAKRPTRVQGCFISDAEVAGVIEYIKKHSESNYDDDIMQEVEQNAENAGKSGKKGGSTLPTLPDSTFDDTDSGPASPEDGDPMMNAAIDIVVETGMASVSSLQRKLKLGYSRAARLVDQMEELGVVGPFEGSKPRKVLITKEEWSERKMRGGALTALDEAKAMSEAADREAMTVEDVDIPPFEVD